MQGQVPGISRDTVSPVYTHSPVSIKGANSPSGAMHRVYPVTDFPCIHTVVDQSNMQTHLTLRGQAPGIFNDMPSVLATYPEGQVPGISSDTFFPVYIKCCIYQTCKINSPCPARHPVYPVTHLPLSLLTWRSQAPGISSHTSSLLSTHLEESGSQYIQ